MSLSAGCASNFVPLLARIVVGAAFITAGYQKIWQTGDFPAEQLHQLGVDVDNLASASTADPGWMLSMSSTQDGRPRLEGGGAGQDVEETDQDTGETQDPPVQDDPPIEEIVEEMTQEDDPDEPTVISLPPTGTVTAKEFYGIAIALNSEFGDREIEKKWFVTGAKVTAWIELVGGALIFVGLFSRLWGLLLAGVMVGAFYVTTLDPLTADAMGFLDDRGSFNRLFTQLGLFVLAFGVFLTGSGSLSLDRFLFKGEANRVNDDDIV